MIRLALIGLGGISQSVHLPVVQRNRDLVELTAVAEFSSSRRETLADQYGIEHRFASVDELVAAVGRGDLQLDAVILATTGEHAADALTLVAAGMKVLAEKPLAYSHASLDRLESGLTRLGRAPEQWIRVGYMKEHDPAVEAARRTLEGVKVRHVGIEVLHPADASQLKFARLAPAPQDVSLEATQAGADALAVSIDVATGAAPEQLRRLYSNVVLGSVVHDISLARHLGLPLANVRHAQSWGVQVPGSVTAEGTTDAGASWTLAWHFISGYPEYAERFTVHHEEGTVELEFSTPYVLNAATQLRVRTAGAGLEHSLQIRRWPQEEAFERQLHALVRLAGNQPTEGPSLAEARQDLSTAQALWNACAVSAGFDPATTGRLAEASRKNQGKEPL